MSDVFVVAPIKVNGLRGGKQGTTGQKVRPYPWSEAKGAPNSTLANYNTHIDSKQKDRNGYSNNSGFGSGI